MRTLVNMWNVLHCTLLQSDAVLIHTLTVKRLLVNFVCTMRFNV